MHWFLRLVPIVALCLSLAACYASFPPVVSAAVTHRAGQAQGAAQPLSPERIARLSAWLQGHRWGWHPVAATYGPGILIWVTHGDGSLSRVNLMRNVLIVGQHQRSLSAQESRELHSMLEMEHDPQSPRHAP